MPDSTVLLVTLLRLVGNKAKDTGEAEKNSLHPIPIWKTHMISSSNNEESIALLDLIPSRSPVGKINICVLSKREQLYSVKLMIILAEIFI